jgi:hypothetical protein
MFTLPALSLRRTSASLLVWSCALATVASAASPAPQTPAAPVTMDGYPAAGAPAIVTVLTPGAAPRVPLRYTIANALKDHLAMNMDTSMQIDMAGMAMPQMQMPTMKVGADLSVTSVSATGDVTYDLAFTGLTVDTSTVDPQLAGMFQGMDADYKAIKGSATVTNRGVPVASKLDTGNVSNPQLKQMLDSLSTSLQNLSMPLPEEPVGVGAKWEVRAAISAGGLQSFQKTTYEIVSIDGKAVSLKTTTESTAPPQAMTNPALPPGTDVQLQKLTGNGTGTATLHLDSLVPTSNAAVQNSMVMAIAMNGNSQTMTTTVTLKIGVSPSK